MSVKDFIFDFVENELKLAEKMMAEDKEFADYNEGRRDAYQNVLDFLCGEEYNWPT